jgi:hypothetical protein
MQNNRVRIDINQELVRLNVDATSQSFNHFGFLVTELTFAIDKNVTKLYHTNLLASALHDLKTNQGIITALRGVEF